MFFDSKIEFKIKFTSSIAPPHELSIFGGQVQNPLQIPISFTVPLQQVQRISTNSQCVLIRLVIGPNAKLGICLDFIRNFYIRLQQTDHHVRCQGSCAVLVTCTALICMILKDLNETLCANINSYHVLKHVRDSRKTAVFQLMADYPLRGFVDDTFVDKHIRLGHF